MANNQIMVNMKFQADTTQAKAKMQELQNSLKSLQSITSMDLPLGKTVSGLEQAKNAAAQLQIQLQTAFNQNTGKLDLTRFMQQMKQSNMSLQQYKTLLSQAGPAGQQAFGQLAVSIASADTHVIRISQRLQKLGTTLANTLRWQISSAALMGVTSTISEAYRFAQDLNNSLNDIRIVTGYSAEQMKKFANEANNAAKALSTTTNEYTKASLIYFQQGLNTKEVKERTDLTIKMANVTGQSVSQVSDQLTAVWNNFYNGTKTLEYYVDVMTALGAATASSSEEISEGLNKFAAVAETVGLSYEYAASALATVTATTRQSADIVGTAFKTLFARIQDLELGKELDDGTTLGQYSQALAAVGINIKDVNGEVKDMNSILDEMGAKWNTLSKDSQIALAQNVAGVRQYTQLIALMDNWDFFQENLTTAYNSTGTLQEQADIYAESWEAARDRVTAALEDIYQDLLDDDTFISILNFFADLLENIDNVIESVGGLNGVLTILAAVLMKVYQNSIATSLSSMGATMMSWTKAGQAKINQTRAEAYNTATTMYDESNASGKLSNQNVRNQIDVETRYNELTANATEQQRAILNIRKESLQKQNEENEKLIEELKTLEQITHELNKQVLSTPYEKNKALYAQTPGNIQQATWESLQTISKQSGASQIFGKELQLELYDDRMGSYLSGDYSDKSLNKASDATSEIITKMESLRFGADGAEKELKELFGEEVYNALEKYYQKLKETQQTILSLQRDSKARASAKTEQDLYVNKKSRMNSLNTSGRKMNSNERKEYKQLEKEVAAYEEKQSQLVKTSNEVDKAVGKTNEQLDKQTNAMIKARGSTEEAGDEVRNFVSNNQQLTQKTTETSVAIGKTKKDIDQLNTTLTNSMGPVTFSQKLTTFASMAMSASMALQGFKSLIDTWNNEDISFGDKLIQSLMSIGMILPALTTLMNKQNMARLFGVNAMKLENGQWIFNTQQKSANTVATWLQKIAQDALNGSIGATIAMFAIFLVAVAAVIGVIYLLTKAQEKEKTALEKATEAAKNQREALDSITEAAKEMTTALEEAKDLISSYSEVSNAFDGLVKGSDAYNENLQKEIELVNQLLEKYPELMDMGIIGQGPRGIQVLDEAALQQYLVGTATVNMLNMQIAQKYAAEDLEINDAIVAYEKKLEEFNNEVAKQKPITAQTENNGQKIIVSDGAGNSWEVNTGFSGQYAKQSADTAASYIDKQFDNWKERLASGKTLQEIEETLQGEYQQNLFSVFQDYLDVQGGYNKQLESINNEHAKRLEEINKKYEAQYLALANQILSYQKGFSQLNQFQQSATTALVSQQLQKNNKTYEFQSGYGVEFSKELGDYILEATGVQGEKWSKRSGSVDEKNNLLNDIGDFFVNTPEGLEAAAKYLQTQGYSDITADKLKNSYNLDTKGITSKEDSPYDIDIDWAEIAGYFQGQAIYEGINYDEFMQASKSRSDATNAAIAKNLSLLSEEQMSRIATGSREEGFKLDETSIDIQEAAKILQLEGDAYNSWIATLTEQVEHYDAALAETLLLQQDIQKGNQLIAESSEKYGLDAEVVENYAKSLYNANKAQGMSYESAAKLAIANGRLSKGIDTLRDKWFDISRTLNTTSKNSYEWMEAATEASQALEEMFGVAVSTDFIDTYSDKITTLVNGGDEAVKVFQELELLAGQDYVMSLNLDEEYKTQFTSMLEELTSQEYEGITVGIKGKIDQSYIDSINKLLEEGAITADEVNAMFNSIGWDPEIGTKDGEPVTTTQVQKITTANNENFNNAEESWQKIETTTIPQVPVIGDVTSAPKSTSSIKTNTTSGSSGGSKKQKKDKNTEVERYHEIKEELQDLQRAYDNISKAKDRAFGKTKLSYLAQELQATEDLIEAQNRYIGEIEDKKIEDTNKLTEYGANIDPNTGRITNYDEMYQANIDQYNQAVDQFNAGKMSEEQFEEYEKEYEEFVKDIEQYEETINLLEGELDKLTDFKNQSFDQKLEGIELSVELDTTLAEDAIKTLQYQIDNLGDSWDKLPEKIELYGKTLDQEVKKMESNKKALNDALALTFTGEGEVDALIRAASQEDKTELENMLNGKELTPDQIQALQDYRDGIIDAEKAAKEMRNTIQDELITTFENWNDEMNEEIDTLDHLSSMLQGYRDIIDLVGKDNLGISNDLLAKMNQTNVDNANTALKSTKTILEANKASLAEAQANLDKARKENQEEDIKFWEETVKTMSETVTAGEEELMSRWQGALQAAADAYTDAVDQVLETFEKAMSGIAGSFDNMQTKYDQQKTINERYLADYEKIYNLSKLTRDIENSINDTDSIRAKSKLRDIQEEIYKLQESGAQVTQYEVDEIRARYDLRLAEIALEEAQNAKSQVRMRRDSEGNWSYVYTADEDATANAAQNVEDKLYAYQELTQNRIQEMQDQMIQLPQEYSDAIRAIATDMTLTEQERQDRMAETTKFYESQYEYLGQQLGIATDDAKWLYENDWSNYSAATGYKISSNQQWIDNFNETILSETTGYNTLSEIHTAFESSTKLMLEGIAGAYTTYETNVDTAMDNAGTSVSDFSKLVGEETEEIKQDAEEAGGKVAKLAEDGKTGFKGLVDAAEEWLDDYQEKMKPYLDENQKWVESIGSIISKYAEMDNALIPLKESLDEVGEKAEAAAAKVKQIDDTDDDDDDDDVIPPPTVEPMYKVNKAFFTSQSASSGAGASTGLSLRKQDISGLTIEDKLHYGWFNYGGQTFYVTEEEAKALAKALDIKIKWNYGSTDGTGRTPDVSMVQAFDTGGYTGAWDSSGRLAMLHQKEIVLNAHDTENFLSAINIVRDIASMIDLRAAAQQSVLSMIATVASAPSTSQTLQQEVTIHAEFPNATERTEIEAAFDTLLNRASQFANRKK